MRSPSCRRWRAATQTLPPGPGRPALVEFEYERGGTLAYLAAWDVHHARLFGRCRAKDRDRAVRPAGRAGHEHRALRVGQDACSGSSTTAQATPASARSTGSRTPPNARLIHLPVHASWLNQIEIYFSILQRKALTPNDFADLDALAAVIGVRDHYRQIAQPFDWTFTRADLDALLARIAPTRTRLNLAA